MTDINVKVDIPGAKEIGGAVEKITDKSINGVGQFLGSICLPVAGEIGAMLAERFSYYRQANLISYAAKLERKLGHRKEGGLHAHPRLLYFATEQASLTDDDDVQELWAGLLSSSCDESGKSQRNMIYMDMLSRMTPDQARIVNFIFEQSTPVITKKGVELSGFKMSQADLIGQSGVQEVEFGDEAISHLLSIDLITAIGGSSGGELAWTLRGLGVAFCVRCQGFVGDPDGYFTDVPSISELRKQGKALFFPHNPLVSEDPR